MLENNINDPILNLEINTTSQLLKSILKKHQTDYVSVGDLLESFNTGGFFLLILISALLVTIPTPPPIAIISGLFIIFFAVQMSIGLSKVWLPLFITKRKIKRITLEKIINKTSYYLEKLEKYTKRRFLFMENIVMERIIGIIIILIGFLTLIPILFVNTIPGLAIIFLSFGMLNKDGLLVAIGIFLSVISFFAVWFMLLFGKTLILKLIKKSY